MINIKLKETFEVKTKHGAFYTGGNIEWHENTLFCQTAAAISLLDIDSGTVKKSIGEENSEDADTIQTFTSDGERLVTAHKSGLLKLWSQNGDLVKMWKYIHKGPVASLVLKGTLLASGGSDGVIRIWDLQHQACVLSLKGSQGVINAVKLHPTQNIILGSGDDGKINSWELEKGCVSRIYNGHFSKVTAISFHTDNKHFVSAGRDKVLMLWDTDNNAPLRTLPVFEAVETVVCLPIQAKLPNFKIKSTEEIYIATGGESGVIRVWNISSSKEIYTQTNSLISRAREEGGLSVVKLIVSVDKKILGVVSAEQNIMLHDLATFRCLKQLVGFSDEILDVTYFGRNDTHTAVATNSADVKVYENSTMNCELLKGHTDIVVALCKAPSDPSLLLSSSKDNTIRLWNLLENGVVCVGIGARHTGSVGSVAFSQSHVKFAVSVSQDTCIKMWSIPSSRELNTYMTCERTEIAHQKDINCVTVSPNDQIIATGSQDKTAKLWTASLTLIGVLKGHRRGIWCVRFSPVDQIVITSSADCTIKLWSIAEFCCLKTLEGHDSSVLKAEFISNGMQILSAGADGLIKLFSLKTSECVSTLDQHESRVWALAVSGNETEIITGGSDSLLVKWKDVTEEKRSEKIKQLEELALQEQELSNYVQSDQLLKALKLALKLDRPHQVLKIVRGLVKKQDSGLADAIKELRDDQKQSLLNCAVTWNTNSKNCQPAQLVLNILLNELQTEEFRPVGLSRVLEGALPYTERHFKRMTSLLQDMHFLNYTINCMQPHAKITN